MSAISNFIEEYISNVYIPKSLRVANIFEIIIPMGSVAELQVGPSESQKQETSKETSKETVNNIVNLIKLRPEISIKDIAQELDMSVSGVRYHIDHLKNAGVLKRVGSTKKGKWILH